MKEDDIQIAFIRYLRIRYPGLLFNSGSLSGTKVDKIRARNAKRMGHVAGFPDVMIYEPRNGKVGLALELKRPGVRLLKKDGRHYFPEQKAVIDRLIKNGWEASFAVGLAEAISLLDSYMEAA